MKFILIFIIGSLTLQLNAQVKVEAEKRIDEDQVPSKAINWLSEAFETEIKMKWYQQKSYEKDSFEAKFKKSGVRYSIEFDTAGQITNIEVKQNLKQIEALAKKNILDYFKQNFENYRIKKIQIQYLGAPINLKNLMKQQPKKEITTNYEIEFYGRTPDNKEFFEALFNNQGHLISQRIIQLPLADNLKY